LPILSAVLASKITARDIKEIDLSSEKDACSPYIIFMMFLLVFGSCSTMKTHDYIKHTIKAKVAPRVLIVDKVQQIINNTNNTKK
jgi:hypothetical protein